MRDFLKEAILVKGDPEARMWSIARDELSKSSKPILLISDLTTHSGGLVSISRIDKIPKYGQRCRFNMLEEIYWADACTSRQPLYQMVNELLSKHCHRNKIFISELAYELCYEEDFSYLEEETDV